MLNRLVAQSGKRVVDTTHQAIGAPHVELTVQFVLHSAPKYSLQPHELQERMSHVFWFQCVAGMRNFQTNLFQFITCRILVSIVMCRCGFDCMADCERSSTDVEKIIPCGEVFEKQTCYGRTVSPTAYAKRQRIKTQKIEWKLRLNLGCTYHIIPYLHPFKNQTSSI